VTISVTLDWPQIPPGHVAAVRSGSHVVEEGEIVRINGGAPLDVGTIVYWISADIIPAAWAEPKADKR
jgi:hypothetical protein